MVIYLWWSSKMILDSGEEERRNDERSEELAKATNELASEEFLRSKNPTRTGKYIYKNAAFKDKKHFTIYCEARNVVPSLVGVLFLISEKVYLYIYYRLIFFSYCLPTVNFVNKIHTSDSDNLYFRI